ncbi:enolase-phosphatase E1 isoform X2 [Amblyomma americanum]
MTVVEAVVLDIEGTVVSISFVKDELFPFARRNVHAYLETHWGDPELMAIVSQLHTQACRDAEDGPVPPVGNPEETSAEALRSQLEANVLWQMDADRKAAPLKALQGLVWKEGYASGQLRALLYPDVVPALTAWKCHRGLPLFIYSSGSVQAQQLLFGHTTEGNITGLLDGYFDITTAGAKTDAQSYVAITRVIGRDPSRILFLTDVVAEAQAAREAGLQVRLVVRPGNAPLTDDQKTAFQHVTSLDQIQQ